MSIKAVLISSGRVLVPPLQGGGVEEYVFRLARHMRDFGIDTLIIDTSLGDSEYVSTVSNTPILRISSRRITNLPKSEIINEMLFGLSVARKMREMTDVNVYHLNSAFNSFIITKVASRKGNETIIIYTCHNSFWPEETVHVNERVVRWVEQQIMRSVDAVIVFNNVMKKSLIERAGIPAEKIFIIPNGTDTNYFRPDVQSQEIHNLYNINNENIILYVGRVTWIKGVHILIKAFEFLINKGYKDIALMITGPLSESYNDRGISKYAYELMEYTRRKLPDKSVIFTGSIPRKLLREVYAGSYTLVLPSFAEAFGMVLVEAMSSGKPVIGSKVGGIPEIIQDGVNGFTFMPGSVLDLSRKIELLLNDKVLARNLGLNARKIAVEKYDWSVIAKKVSTLYNLLIIGKSRV